MTSPDIFLSYSREDQATARRYAEALQGEGFSVWWDQTLNPGEDYDAVTENALLGSKAVVVLYPSARSASSTGRRIEGSSSTRRISSMGARMWSHHSHRKVHVGAVTGR